MLGAQLLLYSPLKPLWIDEILTYYQVAGKSPGAAISSLDTGFNLLPPGYFALLAAVLQFVEFSPLIARGLSCGFIMATIPVMLFALRRQVGRWFAMAAVSGVIFSSPLIYFHNSEARPYGMSLLLVALVALAFLRSSEVKTPSASTLAFLVVANALVATTSYFGGIYSASALAVTIFCDWRMRWFRPRVYGAYVVGWAIFSVIVLPITFQQLAARGDAGTQWLPSFGYAWRQLTKQWAITVWWVLPFLFALGFLLWAARTRSRGVDEIQRPLPQPFLRLAILSVAWLILPVAFILQSQLTDRNLYFNRYFIGSDLGLMILIASLFTLLCRKLSGSLSLDNVTALRPKFLFLAQALVVVFMVTTALRFLTHDAPAPTGSREAVARAEKWTIPKVTFDVGFFIEGFYRSKSSIDYWYLARSDREAAALARFGPPFHVTNSERLAQFREFLFIDSGQRSTAFNLESWARAHGYRITRVHEYRDHQRRSKDFYLVQSGVVVPGQAE